MSDTLQFRFEASALPVEMVVERAEIAEALNEPYLIELDLTLRDRDADLVTLLGSDAVLTVDRGELQRRFCGIVRDVVEGLHEDGELRRARLRVVPALWALSKRRNTRMFQELTVPEILEDVLGAGLGAYGRSVELSLSASYPRREHCLQYQETDLEFVQRLVEEEGISYAFDHDGEVERLVLRDRNGAFPHVVSLCDPLEYQPHELYVRDREPVLAWRLVHRHTTTSVSLRDWDWTRSGDMAVADAQEGADALGRSREHYEHGHGRSLTISSYDQGVRRYQAQDAARQKGVRLEGLAMEARMCLGVSRVIGLAPGTTFELSGHPTIGVDGAYLVTRVLHSDRPASGGQEAERYSNRFECIPLDVPYRPQRRAQKPHIDGVQTAVVTGPAGEEIHVDEHGRIKVHFHWDRENEPDELSSCWIRVQQTWSGAAWGSWWVPRIGMEVIVQFVDGDPDRPLVTGALYDGTNATPYALPAEKTKSTIKSNSSIGGGGFNEFRFEDRAGSEEIYTHAQKDYAEVVEHDHDTLVHNDQTNTVDVDQTQVIGRHQTETVHANQRMTVDGNRTVHVKTNFDETVDGTETRHVVGDVSETFDANEDRTVRGNLTETIRGNETRTVVGNQTETISGGQTVNVGGGGTQTVSGSLSQTVTGGITTTTPATYSLTAVGGLTVTAAAGIKLVAPAGVQVMAPGGIKQVDEFYKWEGAKKLDLSIIALSIMGSSIGATGVAIGGTGVSIGFTDVQCSNVLVNTEQSVAALKSAPMKLYQIAAWVQMSGILNYF
ncbi:MAG: type VI secretion system tip protein VgrG [Sandaracinaceae bacterium]|nr:type VI secretion system tip protein VgrG [Sandaracinaceae bacterium]